MRRSAPIMAIPLALSLSLLTACSSNEEKAADAKNTTLATAAVKPLAQTAGSEKVVSLAITDQAVTARLVKGKSVVAWMSRDGKVSQFKSRPSEPSAAVDLDRLDLQALGKAADDACPAAASQLTVALTSEHSLTLLRCGKDKEAKAVLIDGKPFKTLKDRFSDGGMSVALKMAQAASPKGGPLSVDLSNPDALSVTLPNTTGPLGTDCKQPVMLLPLTAKGSVHAVQTPACTPTKQERKLKPLDLSTIDAQKATKAFATAASSAKSTVDKCQMMEIRTDDAGKPVAAVTCTSKGKPATASSPIN